MKRHVAILLCAAMLATQPAAGQWTGLKENNLPRKADGTLNFDAPAPRTPSGVPDFSGHWAPDNAYGSYDIAYGSKIELPLQPWAKALMDARMARQGIDGPHSNCAPTSSLMLWSLPSFKLVQTDKEIVMLHETLTTFRQLFLDGRELPKNPVPTYLGYSTGRWEKDALVLTTTGFRGTEEFWMDGQGKPHTEKLRVTERLTRPTFGYIDLELTIDDPGAYTKPWTVKQRLKYQPDSEVMEYYCELNEFIEQKKLFDEGGFELSKDEVNPIAPPEEQGKKSERN